MKYTITYVDPYGEIKETEVDKLETIANGRLLHINGGYIGVGDVLVIEEEEE